MGGYAVHSMTKTFTIRSGLSIHLGRDQKDLLKCKQLTLLSCALRAISPQAAGLLGKRESAVSTWSMTKQVSPARYKENNLRVFKVDKHSFVTNLGYG